MPIAVLIGRKPANARTTAQLIAERATEKLPWQLDAPASAQGTGHIRENTDTMVSNMGNILLRYEPVRQTRTS